MTDGILMTAPIEVIATSPRLDMIRARLGEAGLRAYASNGVLSEVDPLFVDTASAGQEQLKRVHRQITRATKRTIILLADGDAPPIDNVVQIVRIGEIKNVPALLDMATRKQRRINEVQLRAQTARQVVGHTLDVPVSDTLDLLFLGDGSSEFLALTGRLGRENIRVTAALTSLTAHQYLRDARFHGLVIDVRKGAKLGAAFLDTYAPLPGAIQLPILALRDRDASKPDLRAEHVASVTEFIDADPDTDNLAARICDLINFHAVHTPLHAEQTSDFNIRDQFTPLFSNRFFEQHLQNQIDDVSNTPIPLSLMTLQIGSRGDGNAAARAAMPIIAASLRTALRQTDCAARLDWSTIGVSLVDTSYSGGVKLAERLVQLLFERHPDILRDCRLNWRVIERRAYHSVHDLISVGKTGPQTRVFVAA